MNTKATGTEQAALLREARDQLAQRAANLDHRGLVQMGLPPERADRIAKGAPFTNDDLAALLGVTGATIRSWLKAPKVAMRRTMPLTAKILLARILADKGHRGK